MAYSSRYDTRFVTFANRKYKKFRVCFEFYDDYILWLFYDYFGGDEELYYKRLEEDIKEYSDFQTGSERNKKGKLNGKWEK